MSHPVYGILLEQPEGTKIAAVCVKQLQTDRQTSSDGLDPADFLMASSGASETQLCSLLFALQVALTYLIVIHVTLLSKLEMGFSLCKERTIQGHCCRKPIRREAQKEEMFSDNGCCVDLVIGGEISESHLSL